MITGNVNGTTERIHLSGVMEIKFPQAFLKPNYSYNVMHCHYVIRETSIRNNFWKIVIDACALNKKKLKNIVFLLLLLKKFGGSV